MELTQDQRRGTTPAKAPVNLQVALSVPNPIPEKYGGDASGCWNFLLSCELYFSEFPEMTSIQKVSMLIQRLTGRAQV